jgi:hypothetical protein
MAVINHGELPNSWRVAMSSKPDNIAFIGERQGGRAVRAVSHAASAFTRSREPAASHPEFPLERICSYMSEPFQLTFARNAQRHFMTREDVEALPSHQGLTIRGETEEVIDAALILLKDLYGPRIRVGPPTVRYHHGGSLEQPWMGLRIRCDIDHVEAVSADLLDRDATLFSCELEGPVCSMHAQAPLASLLGYGASLRKIAGNSARHAIWLSHYAPMEPPPSGGRTA